MTPERFAKLKRILDRRQPDLTVLMDHVHKSHNIAAILRTCDAVGVFEANAVSPDGEVQRHHMVSGGSRKWVGVRLHETVNVACEALRASGHQILAAHVTASSRDYREFDYTRPTAFLMGAELHGVSDEAITLADEHVAVPMDGLVSSLNVSVAAALLLFEARRQREAAQMYEKSRIPVEIRQQVLFEWSYPDIARKCKERGLPYPALTDDGDVAENPFD